MRGNGEQTSDGWHEATFLPTLSNRCAVMFRAISTPIRHLRLTPLSDLAQPVRHTLWALLVVWGRLGLASAQEPPEAQVEPFRVFWSSSADCGSAESFASELKARAKSLRDAARDERATSFFVEVFREGTGVSGQLIVRRPDGQLSTREVPGATCAEVESALALIASLMMDPLSMGGSPVEETQGAITPAQRPADSPDVEEEPLPHVHFTLRAEHRVIGQGGVAPGLSWGQAARLMLTRDSSGWSPSVGLSAHYTGATASGSHGSADLEWLVGQLSACPLAWQAASGWDLRGCALAQLGRLRGTGYQTPSPAARTILWSGAGLQVEGRLKVLGPLWLGWEAAMVFPFTRERFYLAAPEETLHRVPAVAGSFGLGTGLRFF
jgi:hypothetical protein